MQVCVDTAYVHLEWIACSSVAGILPIVCACGVDTACCQLSMKLSVRGSPVALIAVCFWVREG